MEYQVIRTCYYNNRLYEKGEVVALEGSVPEHFSPLLKKESENLEAMTIMELKKVAAEKGLEIRSNKKAELIKAIRGE